ncbi:NLR family CARD domain-containing protein 3-like [Carassius gibelio]|uniref:NLR family CARD domain-containing protein 3-like n=1 Tax=Carassius gibelio TaxID=101364 RepID=UPI0022792AE7|nr:NLR family CARD domain-containing protein 3-like [Carassius gibelio]
MCSDRSIDYPQDFSSVQRKRSEPDFSHVSVRSGWSMDNPQNFSSLPRKRPEQPETRHVLRDISTGHQQDFSSVQRKRSEPDFSHVSVRSDWSIDNPQNFSSLPRKRPEQPETSHLWRDISTGHQQDFSSVQRKRSEPDFSHVSVRSDWSINIPQNFSSLPRKRPEQPETSHLWRDISTGHQQDFSSVQRKRSEPDFSHVSVRSDWSIDNPQNFSSLPRKRPEQAMFSPVSMWRDISTGHQQDFSHEVLNTFRSKLKKKFECLYEGTAMQGNPTPLNEIYTELYITESESREISNEHEVRQIETQSRRTATEDTPIKCRDIFRALPGQDKPIRTVLTKGVAGIGKTVSVQKFILDWAEGKENQDVQLIFPLPFRELNLMKDKTLSLSALLQDFFPETKDIKISSGKYKVLFIFDGLDECRLSLDFRSDVRRCNVSESVSVDVLLKNLIVGNLLPSALIWITSRPAAADLVPSECVHRVTEVRGFNDPQKEEYFRKRVSDQTAVLEKMLSRAERGEIPKTLTQMYTHFLTAQIKIKGTKYNEKKSKDKEMIFKLGKLAYEQLDRGNLIFYEEDLRECGIDVTEASVYSGFSSERFSLSDLHKKAVDVALQSKNGHLDLFLQFLLGLSVESHQVLLQGLMKQTRSRSDRNQKTVKYIKKKIRTIDCPEKSINLFHCLNELGDHSLVDEIQQYLRSGTINKAKLSSSQWSAVVFVLLTSEDKLDEFNLNKFVGGNNKAENMKVLQKLLPVIKESRSVQ